MDQQNQPDQYSTPQAELPPSPKNNKKLIVLLSIFLFVTIGAVVWLVVTQSQPKELTSNSSGPSQNTTNESNQSKTTATPSSTLDHTKLPLGDSKFSNQAKKGYVYSCQSSFNGGGASTYGPWIDQSAKTWDLTKKLSVDGDVNWPAANWQSGENGQNRTISSTNLPFGHNTGSYPISSKDDAYKYDRNPNSIKQQSINFSVPKNPTMLSQPDCVGGEVGIATTGVLIFSAFDAGGRDAVAVEVQDSCEGHPQVGGYYHYHGYSSCLKDSSKSGEHSSLLAYGFDGFGIFGVKGEGGKELSSTDLDECHGHTHAITWDGKQQDMYHYHFTQDFPYTLSCFRGKPSVKALSSGEGQGAGIQQGPPPPR